MLTKITRRLTELLNFRELFWGLVSREIRARYKGSALGFLWTLLNPLMMMAVYAFIFSNFMRVPIKNYALFIFAGLLPWTWFNTSIVNVTSSIVTNAGLIRKIYFPTEIIPIVNVTTNLANFLLSLPALFFFMILFKTPFSWALLQLPVLIAIQFLFTLGIGMILATLNVYYRDVEQFLGSLLLVWFYMTPIIYSAEMIPKNFYKFFLVNPMAPLIIGYHRILLQGQFLHLRDLLYPSICGLIVFALGYYIFNSQRYNFAEVV